MLEPKDWIAISVSALSLVVSATTLYMGQFRRARLVLRCGPRIHIYYDINGGAGFYLPVTFHNRSPARAIVERAHLVLKTPDGRYLSLRWLESAKISMQNGYENTGPATPFKVDGFDSAADGFWFFKPRDVGGSFAFPQGHYELTVHAWSTGYPQPDISITKDFAIDGESAAILASNLETQTTTTRILWFQGEFPESPVSNALPSASSLR